VYTVNAGGIHNSCSVCCLFDHCVGRNACAKLTRHFTLLPTSGCGSAKGMAGALVGKRSVAGELKESEQRPMFHAKDLNVWWSKTPITPLPVSNNNNHFLISSPHLFFKFPRLVDKEGQRKFILSQKQQQKNVLITL